MEKNNNIARTFNDLVRQLGIVLDKIYRDNPAVIIVMICIIFICAYLLIKAIGLDFVYPLIVTLFFIILSVSLYAKNNNALESLLSFSLGIFTAFTVSWNTYNFSIFAISFIILSTLMFVISAIKVSSEVEQFIVTASSFYIYDYDKNKRIIQEIKQALENKSGLLSTKQTWEAILFFAYRKIPKDEMILIINNLNEIYTVTKLDLNIIMTCLTNINLLAKQDINVLRQSLEILKRYLLKSNNAPLTFVETINAAVPIAVEKSIDVFQLCDRIERLTTKGYDREITIKELAK